MSARFKMNSFVKKFLGIGIVLQLAVWVLPAQTRMNLGSLPLWFETAQGGAAATQFVAHGRDSEITISADGVLFALRQSNQQVGSARMEFMGANRLAEISGGAELAGKVNYFTGNDPARWQSGRDAFGQVRVAGIYPGINVVFYGNQQRLEYDFDLQPGARPESVAIRFTGVDKVAVNQQGELAVKLDGREIVQHQPVAYQAFGKIRHAIQVGYKILDAHTVAFSVGDYDPRLPLVIDPVISYSTFFGGNNDDIAWAVALGTNDNSVYIAGQTLSTRITSTLSLATPGAFQAGFQGGPNVGDAFVAKFHDLGTNTAGLSDLATNLIYCTYLGGSQDDVAKALAVDATGHAFVAGATLSANFPVKNAVVYQTYNGSKITGVVDKNVGTYPSDAFVSELETNGASLIFSTYLGGESSEAALGLALDSDDNAYVAGYTYSTNFPVTANAYQHFFASSNNFYVGCNAFVSEISTNGANGMTLNYSTYLGGTNMDAAFAIAFNNGYLAVAGSTCSSNFPTFNCPTNLISGTNYFVGNELNRATNNINNNLIIGPVVNDAFVTLFQTTGTSLSAPLYSTFLGGTNNDIAFGVAVGPSGNVYVVGATTSTNFPSTTYTNQVALPSYLQTNNANLFLTNAFLTQIVWNGTTPAIGYSQMFGGFGNDFAWGVALDTVGNVFIVGQATSYTNLLATTNNLIGSLTQTNANTDGSSDVFITAVKADFSALLYAAYFGSSRADSGYGIAVGADDSAYVVGQTLWTSGASVGFPVLNAWEPVPPDNNNGFLTKIWLTPPALPELTVSNSGTNVVVSWSASLLAQINTSTFNLQTTTNLVSPNWVVVTQNPFSTNEVIAGVTNQLYTYPFKRTDRMQFFRLHASNN